MTSAALVALGGSRCANALWSHVEPLDRREITALASTASAAAYMAGGGNIAALAALVMLGQAVPHPALLFLFWCALGVLGTLLAAFLRRRAIAVGDAELPFPTASATSEIAGDSNAHAAAAARPLGYATAVGAGVAWVRLALHIPATLAMPGVLRGRTLASLTFGVDTSLLLLGVGALMNVRTALSTFAGALVTYLILVPELLARGWLEDASYTNVVGFMVWPTASLLVSAAVMALGLDTRVQVRRKTARARPLERSLWLLLGACAVATTALAYLAFGLPLFYGLFALPIALGGALIAARTMGESDVVPTKALAPFVQLLSAGAGASLSALCVIPNITSSVALHAADTLGSLKIAGASGLREGEVLVARSIGVFVGGAAVLLGYIVLVSRAQALPTAELPAPSIVVWKSVADLLARGAGSIPPPLRIAMLIATLLGSALEILERTLPARIRRFVPSAVGLGTGMVLPASNAFALTIGAIARRLHERGAGKQSQSVPIASGLIAGESALTVAWQVVDAIRHIAAP